MRLLQSAIHAERRLSGAVILSANKDIPLLRAKHDEYFEDEAMLNFALSLIQKGGQKCTFHLSRFKSVHFDQKW